MTAEDRRALVSLLDELCEDMESVIECHTLDGEIGPGRSASDVIAYVAVRRSRRIWRRAQTLMIKLQLEAKRATAAASIDARDPPGAY